jgi:hypothetical protein
MIKKKYYYVLLLFPLFLESFLKEEENFLIKSKLPASYLEKLPSLLEKNPQESPQANNVLEKFSSKTIEGICKDPLSEELFEVLAYSKYLPKIQDAIEKIQMIPQDVSSALEHIKHFDDATLESAIVRIICEKIDKYNNCVSKVIANKEEALKNEIKEKLNTYGIVFSLTTLYPECIDLIKKMNPLVRRQLKNDDFSLLKYLIYLIKDLPSNKKNVVIIMHPDKCKLDYVNIFNRAVNNHFEKIEKDIDFLKKSQYVDEIYQKILLDSCSLSKLLQEEEKLKKTITIALQYGAYISKKDAEALVEKIVNEKELTNEEVDYFSILPDAIIPSPGKLVKLIFSHNFQEKIKRYNKQFGKEEKKEDIFINQSKIRQSFYGNVSKEEKKAYKEFDLRFTEFDINTGKKSEEPSHEKEEFQDLSEEYTRNRSYYEEQMSKGNNNTKSLWGKAKQWTSSFFLKREEKQEEKKSGNSDKEEGNSGDFDPEDQSWRL